RCRRTSKSPPLLTSVSRPTRRPEVRLSATPSPPSGSTRSTTRSSRRSSSGLPPTMLASPRCASSVSASLTTLTSTVARSSWERTTSPASSSRMCTRTSAPSSGLRSGMTSSERAASLPSSTVNRLIYPADR
ncbi:hypothetical protein PENTCL1PPCAC_10800, partial [Pristionchus entomophagus]